MRQFLVGQKFFNEEFGKYCKEVCILHTCTSTLMTLLFHCVHVYNGYTCSSGFLIHLDTQLSFPKS